jgi:hypothetical protein
MIEFRAQNAQLIGPTSAELSFATLPQPTGWVSGPSFTLKYKVKRNKWRVGIGIVTGMGAILAYAFGDSKLLECYPFVGDVLRRKAITCLPPVPVPWLHGGLRLGRECCVAFPGDQQGETLALFVGEGRVGRLCLPKILSGANAFDISDIQEDEIEAGLTRDRKVTMLHLVQSL